MLVKSLGFLKITRCILNGSFMCLTDFSSYINHSVWYFLELFSKLLRYICKIFFFFTEVIRLLQFFLEFYLTVTMKHVKAMFCISSHPHYTLHLKFIYFWLFITVLDSFYFMQCSSAKYILVFIIFKKMKSFKFNSWELDEKMSRVLDILRRSD